MNMNKRIFYIATVFLGAPTNPDYSAQTGKQMFLERIKLVTETESPSSCPRKGMSGIRMDDVLFH